MKRLFFAAFLLALAAWAGVLVVPQSARADTFFACHFASNGVFTAPGETIFNTDTLTATYNGMTVATGQLVGSGSSAKAVFNFDSIDVPIGTSIKGQGSHPLVLLAKTTVTISGLVDVSGHAAVPGPGAHTTGFGSGADGMGTAGDGGGGFGGTGGSGGDAPPNNGGPGGVAYGSSTSWADNDIGGGSSGGGGAAAGVGGGAVFIGAASTITVVAGGVVAADGASGSSGAGGGSGGAIALYAPTVDNEGTVRAKGAAGGGAGASAGGGGGGGGGRIILAGGETGAGSYSEAAGPGGIGGTGNGGPGNAGTFTSQTLPDAGCPSADGSGTLSANTAGVSAGAKNKTITFTYTAATGGLENGTVELTVPSGWSAPDANNGLANGYTTANGGTLQTSGQKITVSGLTLATGGTLKIVYGSRAAGGPGATAPSTTGLQTWQGRESSTSFGTLKNLASSPQIRVYAADGSGTMTTTTTAVSALGTGKTITLSFKAATGGMGGGTVTVAVPSGWSAPSTSGGAPGYTTANYGTVTTSGQTITVSNITRSSGQTVTITYGSKALGGPGATVSSATGLQTWVTKERSTPTGTLKAIASSPKIQVCARDGSGTLKTPTTSVVHGSTGKTIVFTYTAASGGISNGTVTLTVPTGWSAPSTTGTAPGFVTTSLGSRSISGRTIVVSGLTRAGSQTVTITYGSKASGGPGATAPPSAVGAQTWQAKERSTLSGVLTSLLAGSPVISVT